MALSTDLPLHRELTDAELGAWRGMLRVHAAVSKALDAQLESAHGTSLSSYGVLIALRSAPEGKLRMADLADDVLLSRSGMTRLVDRLEGEGLIAREQCPSDARGCFARLTEQGHAFLEQARPTHLSGVREAFLGHLDEEELSVLAACWEKILPGSVAAPPVAAPAAPAE